MNIKVVKYLFFDKFWFWKDIRKNSPAIVTLNKFPVLNSDDQLYKYLQIRVLELVSSPLRYSYI